MAVTKIIKIDGMTCSHCVAAVERALKGLPGVDAKVDLKAGIATVIISGDISDETLKLAIEEEDFEVVSISA
ncbi:MAG: heavy-metal-associated domain-containing protein [Synergistaceae bacterium]|jgi:copper chaperone CopZ|nr:heavy-metal-associated domain-containing protein [Synergistaceae bacterium]